MDSLDSDAFHFFSIEPRNSTYLFPSELPISFECPQSLGEIVGLLILPQREVRRTHICTLQLQTKSYFQDNTTIQHDLPASSNNFAYLPLSQILPRFTPIEVTILSVKVWQSPKDINSLFLKFLWKFQRVNLNMEFTDLF